MWIKICGVRDPRTAQRIAELQPDAVGLNFVSASPRFVALDAAREIVRVLSESILPVGVFVNATIAEIERTVAETGLRGIQLHGDEPASFLAGVIRHFPALTVIRAWRIRDNDYGPLADDLDETRRLGSQPAACLVDAHVAGAYGGTGKAVGWSEVQTGYRSGDWPPLVLAGGLGPENVAEAIGAARPWGVDVASGVESAPGVKDLDQVAAFIARAREAGLTPAPSQPSSREREHDTLDAGN